MTAGRRARRVGERMLRGTASRLSPARGEALVAAAKAGYALITGRRPRRYVSSRREPNVDRHALQQVEAALESGDMEAALTLTERLLERHPQSFRILQLRKDALTRMGDLRRRAAVFHRQHMLDNHGDLHEAERALLGRIVETTPGWLPRIPGPPDPIEPASDDVVLHLLKESSPHLTTGFTMRSRYNLLAARDAGVQPEVVTALGFPRLVGVTDIPALEMVDDIPHHRLDLGPFYPLTRPVDQYLEETAFLVAKLAKRIRPAVIHASSGHRGFEFALVGAALREHIQRPMVYEVRSFFETTWAGGDDAWAETGEQYERRHATETRAMQLADHVITIGEAMRDDIVARGVDPDRISIIPNGVETDVFTPEPPSPALRRRYRLDGTFSFGYVSNLDHRREGQEVLIDATRILLDRGRNVRCLIVGDGKRREILEKHARQAGVAGSVVFTGRVPHDEVRGHYALLDAFVVPRIDERAARMVTPLKPFEAMAMARPMVVSELPALVEIAAPEERGLTFTPSDAAGLASALERLMDDPALAARIGEAGREWVARERRWSDNGPRFRDVYARVIDEWQGNGRARTSAPSAFAEPAARPARPRREAAAPRRAATTRRATPA